MRLYEAGIIQLEDIKRLVPEFSELMNQKYSEQIKEGTQGVDDIIEAQKQGKLTAKQCESLLTDLFERKLESKGTDRKEVLIDILETMNQESVETMIVVFGLYKELSELHEEGRVLKEVFEMFEHLKPEEKEPEVVFDTVENAENQEAIEPDTKIEDVADLPNEIEIEEETKPTPEPEVEIEPEPQKSPIERLMEELESENPENYWTVLDIVSEHGLKEELLSLYAYGAIKDEGNKIIIMGYLLDILSLEDFERLREPQGITEDQICEFAKQGDLSRDKIIELARSLILTRDSLDELRPIIGDELYELAIKSIETEYIINQLGLNDMVTQDQEGKFSLNREISYQQGEQVDFEMPEIIIPDEKECDRNGRNGVTKEPISDTGAGPDLKFVIDPWARDQLFSEMYGAIQIPNGKIRISDKSAFKNYVWYILPEADGSFNNDSLIVGEAYEENTRYGDTRLAYGNATYIYRASDLGVTSKKGDDEIEDMLKKKNARGTHRVLHTKNYARNFRRKLIELKGQEDFDRIYTKEEQDTIKEWEQRIDIEREFDVEIDSR